MVLLTYLSLELSPSTQPIQESKFRTGVQETQDQLALQERHLRSKSLEERILDVLLETHLLKP